MHLTRGIISCLLSTVLSGVIFSDSDQDKRQLAGRIQPCPDDQLFCDEISDYPTNIKIQDSVEASGLIRNAIFDAKPKANIVGRIKTFEAIKESRACDSRKGTVYPKKAMNIEGEFVFIVNDDKYRQAVEIEQCLGEGEICRTQSDAPFSTTVCRQKFATYRMYVINKEGKQVYDSFSLPSACLCHHNSAFAIKNGFTQESEYPQLTCPTQEDLALNQPSRISPPEPGNPKPPRQNKPPRKDSSKINFGDRKKREVEEPNGCTGNYCEESDSYPAEAVLGALTTNSELNPELVSQLFDSSCKDLKRRFFDIDEEQVCEGIPKIIFPKQARNLKDEWRFIVNIENYTQSVEIEECSDFLIDAEAPSGSNSSVKFNDSVVLEEFGSCLYSGSPGNNPALTVCRQLFTTHKLLSLTTEGQLDIDSFQLPSACACYYKEDYVLEFRNNFNSTTSEDDIDTTIDGDFRSDINTTIDEDVSPTIDEDNSGIIFS